MSSTKSSSLTTRIKALLSHPFVKFVIAGGINTGVTYLIYLFVLLFTSYPVAFTVSYVAGIVIAYPLNSLFVFRVRLSLKKSLQFPIVYLVQYGLNMGLLYLFIDLAGLAEKIAPLLAIVIVVPITFLMIRFVLKGGVLGSAGQTGSVGASSGGSAESGQEGGEERCIDTPGNSTDE
ncbi:unnamed protein product, partial [marine sediment metagenome]